MALFTGGTNLFDESTGQMAAPRKSTPVRLGQDVQNNPMSGGRQGLQSVFADATNGVINNFNTSANRLRERLDAATRGNAMQARDANLMRGFGASTQNDMDQFRVKQAGLSEYSQGLAKLMDDFEKNRLQGLGIANDSASRMTESEDLWDTLNYNLLNNREGRRSAEGIAGADRTSREALTREDMKLRDTLNNRDNMSGNWRSALNLGDNKNPYNMTVPGGTVGGSIQEGGSLNTGALFGFPTGTFPTYGPQTGGFYSRRG